MITINGRKLCENCFIETDSEPCSYCSFEKKQEKRDISALPMGSVLDKRYMIGGILGKGGFGITYLAYDMKLERRIAIKEYYPRGLVSRGTGDTTVTAVDEDSEKTFSDGAKKFYKEAELVSQFNGNPNIVNVHDFFRENDTVYFTMGYMQGETLKSYIRNQGCISEGQAMTVYKNMTNALLITHSMNVLHRDISPDNIMVCNDGTTKLLDFGAARQVIAEESNSLSVILKQGFAPLEQYQKKGRQGPWTDIYALGVTIYTSITGDHMDDPMSRMDDDSEFLSNSHGISTGLWEVIKKSTMLKIEDRYQDIVELKKDLNALMIKEEPFDAIDIKSQSEEELISVDEATPDPDSTVLLEGKQENDNEGATVFMGSSPEIYNSGDNMPDTIGNERPDGIRRGLSKRFLIPAVILLSVGLIIAVIAITRFNTSDANMVDADVRATDDVSEGSEIDITTIVSGDTETTHVTVESDEAVLYDNPSTLAGFICKVEKGEKLRIEEDAGSFYLVSYYTKKGYIRKDDVKTD